MSAPHDRGPARRRAPRPIGPAVLELVRTPRDAQDAVEVRLSAMTAPAIVHIDMRRHVALAPPDAHAAFAALARSATVDRATAQRWRDDAWQAVGEGLLAPADAQALSDQLEPRGAA
ncbi:MAG: hypothetical protein ACLGI5_16440 [Thermoleophilia bacterium]